MWVCDWHLKWGRGGCHTGVSTSPAESDAGVPVDTVRIELNYRTPTQLES